MRGVGSVFAIRAVAAVPPDGRRLAVAALRGGLWSLQSVDASSGAPAPILPANPPRIYVRYPEWSPRGNAIVFEHGGMRGNIWSLAIVSDVAATKH